MTHRMIFIVLWTPNESFSASVKCVWLYAFFYTERFIGFIFPESDGLCTNTGKESKLYKTLPLNHFHIQFMHNSKNLFIEGILHKL